MEEDVSKKASLEKIDRTIEESKGSNNRQKSKMDMSGVWEAISIFPVIGVVAFLPILMRLRSVTLTPVERILYNVSEDIHYDVYTKVKAEWLMICAIAALVLFLILMLRNEIAVSLRWFMIPVFVYTIMVIVSTLFARYRGMFNLNYQGIINNPEDISGMTNLGINGFLDHYEGMQILLCYVILFLVVYYMVRTPFQQKVVITALILSGCVMSVGAILQYFSIYFHETELGLRMILGGQYELMKERFDYKLGQYYSVGTLYNPNYLGGYASIVLMVAVGQYFSEVKRWRKGVFLIASLLIFACLLTSNSSAGILAASVAFLYILISAWRGLLKQWKAGWALIFGFAIVLVLLNALSDKRINSEFSSMGDELGMISGTYADSGIMIKSGEYHENGITLTTTSYSLTVFLAEDQLVFLDDGLQLIPIAMEEDIIHLDDERYSDVTATYIGEYSGLNLNLGGHVLALKFEEQGITVLSSGAIRFPLDRSAPYIGFEGSESFASNRGYIWSRTLPLLKEAVLIGYGPDTFVSVFPQYDVLGKVNYMHQSAILVDKPHNIYMQVWSQTGLVSLVALASIVIGGIKLLVKKYNVYKKRSINTVDGRKTDHAEFVYMGLAASFVAFTVQGIANDSTIPVTVIVWVLLGMSYRISESENREVTSG